MRALIVRVGIMLLAAVNLWWGLWALVAPRNFFDTFPGVGHHWTAVYPPYNQHLVVDLGLTFIALGFLLTCAAIIAERRVRDLALGTVLLFNAGHFGYHLVHHEGMDTFDAWASLATLAAGVVGPMVLLALIAVTPRRTHSPPDRPA